MSVTKETLAALPPLQRRMAEAWLTRFEDGWHPQKLYECMQALPPQSILRRPLLLAMIERDMGHHWQDGRAAPVENYLSDYPELGSVDEIPIELIATEYRLREKHTGNADLSEFAERFPSRIDDLYVLLKPDIFDTPIKPAAPSPEDRKKKRLMLLQAPPDSPLPVGETEVGDRPANVAKKKELDLPEQVPIGAAANPTPPEEADPTAGEVDLFAASEQPKAQTTNSVAVQPAESMWLDVEKLRDNNKTTKKKPAVPEVFIPPQGFGRYIIEKKLNEGVQAVLYEARDTQLERRVVVKVPNFPPEDRDAARAIFHREGRAAATVFHPSLCPIYDIGQIDKIDYLTMPFVEGEALSEIMKRQPVWPQRQAVYLILKVASALDVAHRQGVVHRDLRPTHIVLTTSEIPVIVGFGRAGRPERYDDPTNAAYIAPELLNDQRSGGPRSDIYSIGVILQRLVTGRLPGQAGSPGESAEPAIDSAIRSVIRKATATSPEDRYGSMRDLILELNNIMQSSRSVADTDLPFGPSHPGRSGPSTSEPVPLPVNTDSGVASAQMSELRKLTNSVTPSGKPAPVPYYRRGSPWWWYVASGVAGAVLMLTVLTLGSKFAHMPDPDTPPNNLTVDTRTSTAKQPPPKEPTFDELVKALMAAPPGKEREDAAYRFKKRNNSPEEIAFLQTKIAEDVWPEGSTADTNGKNALLLGLKEIDFKEILPALEQAASPKTTANYQLRLWACTQATEFGIADVTELRWLRIVINAMLEDPSNKVRRVAAQLLRRFSGPEEETVKALIRRITDDNWIVDTSSDSPSKGRVDDSRAEALETLRQLADDRVKDALLAAKKSRNPKVRGWAEEAYREKIPQ